MNAIVGAGDRFVETVQVGDQVLDRQEGTIQQLKTVERLMQAAPAPSAGTQVDEVIKVLTFVWDIVKDSTAQAATEGARTRVLSTQDNNWVNYENAVDFTSDEVKYRLDNLIGTNCYTVNFRVTGTYQARHRTLGGSWLPLVHITFSRCDANFPWIINGRAKIDADAVSNMATRDDPVPQIVLGVNISTKAKFILGWESHERNFVFNVNARTGVKLVATR